LRRIHLRKIFGVLLSTMLVFASVGFASAATKIPPDPYKTTLPPDPYKTTVPPDPYKTTVPPDPYKSPAASGVGIAACASTMTRTINPVPAGAIEVALVSACSAVRVMVYNMGPSQVTVYLVDALNGMTIQPVRTWLPSNSGTSYTWGVHSGRYRVMTYNPLAKDNFVTWASYRVDTQ
jgi:hypothetical protein